MVENKREGHKLQTTNTQISSEEKLSKDYRGDRLYGCEEGIKCT